MSTCRKGNSRQPHWQRQRTRSNSPSIGGGSHSCWRRSEMQARESTIGVNVAMDNLCLFDQIWRPEAGRSGRTACPSLSGASPRPSAPLSPAPAFGVLYLGWKVTSIIWSAARLPVPLRWGCWRLVLALGRNADVDEILPTQHLLTILTTEVQPHHRRPERAVSDETLSFADH